MVLERIKEYIDSKGITISAFEKAVGLSNASFRKALNAGKGIGSDKLENILIAYPDLSAEWLLRGAGNMLIGLNEEEQSVNVKSPIAGTYAERETCNDSNVHFLHNNQTVIIGNWEGMREILETAIEKSYEKGQRNKNR